MRKKTILFIVGMGYSGSTIIDMALGSFPGAFSLGELKFVAYEINMNNFCACGERFLACPFWTKVVDSMNARMEIPWESLPPRFFNASELLSPNSDHQSKLNVNEPELHGFFQRNMSKVIQLLELSKQHRWHQYSKLLYDVLFDISGADLLIDSSKDIYRPLFLCSVLKEYDVRILFLVRDVRGYIFSKKRDKYKFYFPGDKKPTVYLRTPVPAPTSARKWYSSNRNYYVMLTLLVSPLRWKVGSYENISEDPAKKLTELVSWCGLGVHEFSRQFEDIQYHNMGGNVSRFRSRAIQKPSLQWKETLTPEDLACYRGPVLWLNRMFGYR